MIKMIVTPDELAIENGKIMMTVKDGVKEPTSFYRMDQKTMDTLPTMINTDCHNVQISFDGKKPFALWHGKKVEISMGNAVKLLTTTQSDCGRLTGSYRFMIVGGNLSLVDSNSEASELAQIQELYKDSVKIDPKSLKRGDNIVFKNGQMGTYLGKLRVMTRIGEVYLHHVVIDQDRNIIRSSTALFNVAQVIGSSDMTDEQALSIAQSALSSSDNKSKNRNHHLGYSLDPSILFFTKKVDYKVNHRLIDGGRAQIGTRVFHVVSHPRRRMIKSYHVASGIPAKSSNKEVFIKFGGMEIPISRLA